MSRIAELGQQWFGGLGQEPILSSQRGGGGRPANPSRMCGQAGPDTFGRLRQLLSGY